MQALCQSHAPPPVTVGAPTGSLLTDLWQDLRERNRYPNRAGCPIGRRRGWFYNRL
jgi:hypothetical protein